MATDFFERQSRARRNTIWLVATFLLATLAIVATVFVVTALTVGQAVPPASSLSASGRPFPWEIPLFAAGASLVVILGGTIVRVLELRAGGGASVAAKLGGRKLLGEKKSPAERRVLNVVEEMAIASGVPVPTVFMLDEPGINAFAAGYAPSDAVIGVTRGAVEQLSRDELQGVIAHEFSHILNGDMRMSIRLIGILNGILLLGLVGRMLLRSGAHGGSRSKDDAKGALAILAIGLVLILLGFMGSVIGGILKATISREREYLADASAVQFTRNPRGIAGALKAIGAAVSGSKVKAAAAAEASHMFFAQGVWEGFTSLMATHPPLPKRIRAIEPDWDGTFNSRGGGEVGYVPAAAGAAGFAGEAPSARDTVDIELVDHAVEQVGAPQEMHRQYAAQLIADLPEPVQEAARESFGARAVVYLLLLDSRKEIRQIQIAALKKHADDAVLQAASKLQADVAAVDARARLPLIDLTLPALRMMSDSQFENFINCVNALVAADKNLALFEWTLGRIIERHLTPLYHHRRNVVIKYYRLGHLQEECNVLLSTLAHLGHSPENAALAFQAATALLPELDIKLLDREACSLAALKPALAELERASAKLRGRILDACAAVICADGHVIQAEAELLRGIADLLDCPVPPLIAGQKVQPAAVFQDESN